MKLKEEKKKNLNVDLKKWKMNGNGAGRTYTQTNTNSHSHTTHGRTCLRFCSQFHFQPVYIATDLAIHQFKTIFVFHPKLLLRWWSFWIFLSFFFSFFLSLLLFFTSGMPWVRIILIFFFCKKKDEKRRNKNVHFWSDCILKYWKWHRSMSLDSFVRSVVQS